MHHARISGLNRPLPTPSPGASRGTQLATNLEGINNPEFLCHFSGPQKAGQASPTQAPAPRPRALLSMGLRNITAEDR